MAEEHVLASTRKDIERLNNNSDKTGEESQTGSKHTDVTDLSSHDFKLLLEKSLAVLVFSTSRLGNYTRLGSMSYSDYDSFTKTIFDRRRGQHDTLNTIVVVLNGNWGFVETTSLSSQVRLVALDILTFNHHHVSWHLLTSLETDKVTDD